MDERVYEIDVCVEDMTQAASHFDGTWLLQCPTCGGRETKRVRFRVSRSQLLKQVIPRQSLIERTVYFGCVGQAGHYYWHRGSEGLPYSAKGYEGVTPWGTKVDGGLFPKGSGASFKQGEAHIVHHDDGWTAVAFTDRSVDSRPGSWSVYCIPAVLDGPEALAIAREAFSPIFERYTFPVVLVS